MTHPTADDMGYAFAYFRWMCLTHKDSPDTYFIHWEWMQSGGVS